MPITEPIITLRQLKGRELSFQEGDSNFSNLKLSVMQLSSNADNLTNLVTSNFTSLNNAIASLNTTHQADVNTISSELVTIAGQVTQLGTSLVSLSQVVNTHETRLDSLDTTVSNHTTTLANHETRLAAAETTLGNLSSAFKYIGSVAGGTSQSPTDLSTLSPKTAGSYYRVSASGYVSYNGVVKFVNANDGIVFNKTSSYDVIDNTNATISGTPSNIAVTGNADSGYVIDLDPVVKNILANITGGFPAPGGVVEVTYTSTSADPNQLIDSVSDTYRVIKYIVTCKSAIANAIHTSEILMTQDGTNTYLTEYAKLLSDVELVTFSADLSGGQFSLLMTPTQTDTEIKMLRLSI